MENNWPETVGELVEECQQLIRTNDLYKLGKRGEPYPGETKPRVDGTEYLAGEYQYGVAMIPAQWVTHVIEAATLESESRWHKLFSTPKRAAHTAVAASMACTNGECGECPFCGFQKCPEYGDYDALLEWLRGDAE